MIFAVQGAAGYKAVRGKLVFRDGLLSSVAPDTAHGGEAGVVTITVLNDIPSMDWATAKGRAVISKQHFRDGRLTKIDELGEVDVDFSELKKN